MKKTILSMLLLAAPFCHADNFSTKADSHEFGIMLGSGNVSSDFLNDESDSSIFGGFLYNYHFSDQLGFEISHISGDTDEVIITGLDSGNFKRSVEFTTYNFAVKGGLKFSERWRGYGLLGLNYHNLDLRTKSTQVIIDDNGVGVTAGLGIEFRAYNGFGLALESRYLSMGDTDATTTGLVFSWLF